MKKAFTYSEIIISIFILISVLVPAIKLNSQQLNLYRKINIQKQNFDFFTNLTLYLNNKDIFFEENKEFVLTKPEDFFEHNFLKNFSSLEFFPTNFSINIKIQTNSIDFYTSKFKYNIFYISYSDKKHTLQSKILKFKE